MLDRVLTWYFASRNPAAVRVRDFVRRHSFVRQHARALYLTLNRLAGTAPQIMTAEPRLAAILAARAIGGAIDVAELEQISRSVRQRMRVLCLAEGLERDQIRIMLDAAGARVTYDERDGAQQPADFHAGAFDLVIAAPAPGLERQISAVREKIQPPNKLLIVGNSGKRSAYSPPKAAPSAVQRQQRDRGSIAEKLYRSEPISIVLVNDNGLRHGSGTAAKRQAASLLLKGHDVAVVGGSSPGTSDSMFVTGVRRFDNWQGVHSVEPGPYSEENDAEQIATVVAAKVRDLDPDVAIIGGLHAANWPVAVIAKLRSQGILTVAYMHDVYLVTGRCAHPESCQLYQTGCNSSCPTANEYPSLAPDKIGPAWLERGALFTGEHRVPLACNSHWTRGVVRKRFGDAAKADVVHLGIDHELFAPMPKSVARSLLGIPDGKIVITMGAVDVADKWKGGPLFTEICEWLRHRDDVSLVLFGRASERIPATKSLGLVDDERIMPLILNSADIFVSTAIEEAFGQTLLEASACGVPAVAFDVGGISDILVHEQSGLLALAKTPDQLKFQIERLLDDASLREKMGASGRRQVEAGFTLAHQGDAWVNYLRDLTASAGGVSPSRPSH